MPALLTALGTFLAKIFGDNVLRFVAGKAILTALFIVILPIVLNNFLYDIMQILFQWVSGKAGGTGIDASQSFDGLCAYLMQLFRITECIAVITAALLLKVTLKHVPFLRF